MKINILEEVNDITSTGLEIAEKSNHITYDTDFKNRIKNGKVISLSINKERLSKINNFIDNNDKNASFQNVINFLIDKYL